MLINWRVCRSININMPELAWMLILTCRPISDLEKQSSTIYKHNTHWQMHRTLRNNFNSPRRDEMNPDESRSGFLWTCFRVSLNVQWLGANTEFRDCVPLMDATIWPNSVLHWFTKQSPLLSAVVFMMGDLVFFIPLNGHSILQVCKSHIKDIETF